MERTSSVYPYVKLEYLDTFTFLSTHNFEGIHEITENDRQGERHN